MTRRSETSETSEGTPTGPDLVSHPSLVSHVHHLLLELRLTRHRLADLLDRLAQRDRKRTR
jgi:hypothetical protein